MLTYETYNKQDCNVNAMFLKSNKMQLISWYGFIATECTNTYSNNKCHVLHRRTVCMTKSIINLPCVGVYMII